MKIELPRYQSFQPTGWEWLPELPAEWEGLGLTRRIERIVDYRGATPEKVDDGTFLITAKNVRNGQIDYAISTEYVATEALETIMRRGKPRLGDLLLTMEAPLGEVANIDREDIALAQRLVKIRPKSKFFSPYFLKYWMMSVPFRQHIKTHGTGSIAVGIKASKLHLLRVVQPPRDVQDAIVTFLDRETAKIDRLMAVRQKQVERLQEQRTAVIHHAVTKGLDPHAKLKPSGVEWLGNIPKAWRMYRLKFTAKIKNGQDYKLVESDSGYPVMGSGGQFSYANAYMHDGESVLFGRKGTINKPLYMNERFWTVDTMFYTQIKPVIVPKFLYYCAIGFPFEYYSTQTALPSMTQQDIGNHPLAVPSVDEQQRIITYIETETAKLDTLISKYARELDLLAEYRASLISHAVTGKIDVRGLVEPSPSDAP